MFLGHSSGEFFFPLLLAVLYDSKAVSVVFGWYHTIRYSTVMLARGYIPITYPEHR